jgi:hypothetical protein
MDRVSDIALLSLGIIAFCEEFHGRRWSVTMIAMSMRDLAQHAGATQQPELTDDGSRPSPICLFIASSHSSARKSRLRNLRRANSPRLIA